MQKLISNMPIIAYRLMINSMKISQWTSPKDYYDGWGYFLERKRQVQRVMVKDLTDEINIIINYEDYHCPGDATNDGL